MSLLAPFKLIRPHQWSKNLLVFVVPAAAHAAWPYWVWAGVAFVAMCGAASFVYVLNDWLDREADRAHPRKSRRPIASGAVGPVGAVVTGLVCLGVAAIAASFSKGLFAMIAIYIGVSLSYVFWLKKRPICDLAVLATLYGVRVAAGAVAGGLFFSPWLVAFTGMFFLGLAALKRLSEIASCARRGEDVPARGYIRQDEMYVTVLALAAMVASIVVLSIYIADPGVTRLYAQPAFLWGTVGAVTLWTLRVTFLAHRGSMHDDPVVFALSDGWSLIFIWTGAWFVAVASGVKMALPA